MGRPKLRRGASPGKGKKIGTRESAAQEKKREKSIKRRGQERRKAQD